MVGEGQKLGDAASSRILAADRSRRRRVVLGVASVFAVLSAVAGLRRAVASEGQLAIFLHGAATLAYLAVIVLAHRSGERDTRSLAGWLLGLNLLHLVLSVVGVVEPNEVSWLGAFCAVPPLVAATTLQVRGTVLTAAGALLAVGTMLWIARALGLVDAANVRAVVIAPLFFILVADAVAILSALAARHSFLEQLERQREAERAEADRLAAERRLRLIADQVSDLVAVADAQARHVFVSASYEYLLGEPAEAMLGARRADLVHPEDAEAMSQAWDEAVAGDIAELVCRLRRREGTYRTFHVRLQGVEIDGAPHVALTARDITELRALTEELESVRRMDALGRLAAGVAHDFNNLLSVIASCGSMAGHRLTFDHPAQNDLAVLDEAVSRAAELTAGLLAFARRQVMPRQHVVPGEAIVRIEPLLRRAAGEESELHLDLRTRWPARIGEAQLQQVLMNLVVNARDATPGGGRVEIRAVDTAIAAGEEPHLEAGDYVVIEVQDDGEGMDPQVQARIFEPFFSTKGAGGSGLGLATSFGIARQVGGNLRVVSAPGEGSTFRLYIPRSTQKPEAAESSAPPALDRGAAPRVLVVDDEPHIRGMVAELLHHAGAEAETAGSAAEALAQAGQGRFAGILTDVVLGDEDGLEVLGRLQRLQPSARIVVMSGFAPSPERLVQLRESGIRFLPKPFATRELLRALGL